MANRRRGTEKRQLTALVNVRMPPGLKLALEAQAEIEGLTPVAMARKILADHLPNADPADAVPIPSRSADFLAPPHIVHEMASAREAAAEACGMLVQAARRYRETGMAEQHAEAEAVLRMMARAAGEMLDLSAEISQEWKSFMREQRPASPSVLIL